MGIAHSTVSEALHDSPRVSAEIRQKVRQAARETGYQPNPMAVALGQQRQHTGLHAVSAEIAWINCWKNPGKLRSYKEFDLYWQGAYQMAEHSGYRLEEFRCHNLSGSRLEKILRARSIRGVIIPPNPADDLPDDWHEISWEEFSIIRLGFSVKFPPAQVVVGNHLSSGLAFENMHRLGYRRIGYVYGTATTTVSRAGFLMKQMDIAPKQRGLIFPLPKPENSPRTQALFTAWLKKQKPDAIFTDIAAMRKMIEAAGYQIPGDIGLAVMSVMDGNADAGIFQNSELIGQAAAEMVISQINNNSRGIPTARREILIEGRWVDGSSLPPRKRTDKL